MKLLFSETRSDYSRYVYPYVIWAVPDAGETPADLFQKGFLPASPLMDCYYLCRNLRVDLRRFKPSSENRRILRKGSGIEGELVARSAFDYTEERREAWKAYADQRFGEDIMPFRRLDALMGAPVISHVLRFTDTATGRDVGAALLFLQEPAIAYYYYAFYDLGYLARNLGMYMMTWAVRHFAERGLAHLHLGTCYSERALYKAQFEGVEFCNGFQWSRDLRELKFMLARDRNDVGRHLLDLTEYRDGFHDGALATMAARSGFSL